MGRFDECWDNTGMACCIWYYTPQGFREHVGTFRAQYHFRHTAEMCMAMKEIQREFSRSGGELCA
jgi:hypothetical protein